MTAGFVIAPLAAAHDRQAFSCGAEPLSYQGRQLGAALLFDAIARAVRADAAVFALVVDAKNEAAARFYPHHGFQEFSGRTLRLFLPMATARKVVEG